MPALSLSIDIRDVQKLALAEDEAPLFFQYKDQHQPQPAYIEMDENGRVSADWDDAIGGGVPMKVYNRRTLRWPIPNSIRRQALCDFIEQPEVISLLERIHAGHEVVLDRQNNRVGSLSDDALDASAALREKLEGIDENDLANIWSTESWLANANLRDIWPADKSLDEALDEMNKTAKNDGIYLYGDLEKTVLDIAAYEFDTKPEFIESIHADTLLQKGLISKARHEYWALNYAEHSSPSDS